MNEKCPEIWYSRRHLKQAWKYARLDSLDNFVFDIINNTDISSNLAYVIDSLFNRIRDGQYTPTPLTKIKVPKNSHSVRPGTVIDSVDLIYLYAIVQQLAPALDNKLCRCAYAYRFNPKSANKGQELFANLQEIKESNKTKAKFPYNWFLNWNAFQMLSKEAANKSLFVAVTDITSYFENISLEILRDKLLSLVEQEHRELVERLFSVLEYWNWNPRSILARSKGLPQGNDVSSFLSNIYLIDLDLKMLEIVKNEALYFRYVDDIKIFTNNATEAKRALVTLEETLRDLNLNIQSAKTKIMRASEIFDKEVEQWSERISGKKGDKSYSEALNFCSTICDTGRLQEELERWRRPYFQCLTIFRKKREPALSDLSIQVYLENESVRYTEKIFNYLKEISPKKDFTDQILWRLRQDTIFPYHRAYLYRLAAYQVSDSQDLRHTAMEEIKRQGHWYCRSAALFCLHTFALDQTELGEIYNLLTRSANATVLRSAFIALFQCSNSDLHHRLREKLDFFQASNQEYFRRYILRLMRDPDTGISWLKRKKQRPDYSYSSVLHNLHAFDLLKMSSHPEIQRDLSLMLATLIGKSDESLPQERLKRRLQSIVDRTSS